MFSGQVGWDAGTVDYYLDLTTKLTTLYLALSVVALVIFVIQFVFRERSAALQKTSTPEVGYARARVAIVELRKWSQLTALILFAYSTTEITNTLRSVSLSKVTGIGALTGSLAQIFSMWTAGLWFLSAMCVLSWILSRRLARA